MACRYIYTPGMSPILDSEAYASWVRTYDTLSDSDRIAISGCVGRLSRRPLFSVVAVNPASTGASLRTIDSVRTQLYPYWELLASPVLLSGWSDPRVVPVDGSPGDPLQFYNAALAKASGEFILILPADSILAAHAIFELAHAAITCPDVDMIFSDEDRIDAAGQRSQPSFKTDWDPDLMLARDAVGAVAALRTSTARRMLGMRGGMPNAITSYDLLQYDLVLRLGEDVLPGKIHHIPAILCHRPRVDSVEVDPEAARGVVRRHLTETGFDKARVEAAPLAPACNRVVRGLPVPAPLVSIIVPTRDRPDLLARCADGVLSRTDYPSLELIVVDNDSVEDATRVLLSELSQDPRVHVLAIPGPFNYSALNNVAAAAARGAVLVMLNNDTDVISPDWLTELVSHAVRPEIGAVGAKLLYQDGRVQHCGITLGPGWSLIHQLRLSRRDDPGPLGELALVRTVSAVTAACMAIRKSVFLEAGGFDAQHFPTAFSDVDLCLRLGDYGYRVICTPFAELYHLESLSRGYDDTPEKQAITNQAGENFRTLWEPLLETDPYHNPNLHFQWEDTKFAMPPRRQRPWRSPDLERSRPFPARYEIGFAYPFPSQEVASST